MGELRKSILRKAFAQPPAKVGLHNAHSTNKAESQVALARSLDSSSFGTGGSASQWELSRVVSGHSGWVHSVAFDPENEFLATGSADQTIKIWSLYSGALQLTLTGHRMAVRAVTISAQLPYLFSAGEDKVVFCWDLEHNQIVRQYHGHFSGVYCAALHPTIPYILVTGSRDSTARVWDVRTRACVHVLQGHDGPVNAVALQDDAPHVLTASQDRSVRLWDLASGSCESTLTQHTNSVRALSVHPTEQTFVSGGRDGLRQWKLPEGSMLGNFGASENDGVTMTALNEFENTIYAGYDSGVIRTFDYATGHLHGELRAPAMPGSLSSEAAVLCGSFDATRSRLVTGHMDKTVRMWKPASP